MDSPTPSSPGSRPQPDLPDWWNSEGGLSSDPDHRQRQLRYIDLEIQQQRQVLLTLLIVNVLVYAALIVSPSWPIFAGAGASSLLLIPVMHFFKPRPRRSPLLALNFDRRNPQPDEDPPTAFRSVLRS